MHSAHESNRSPGASLERAERAVLQMLRATPSVDRDVDPLALFTMAERHGVSGVVVEAWRAAGLPLPRDLEREVDLRAVARALDHRAHLRLLESIDARFADERLVAVALKGPMFAERYYMSPRVPPSERATSDTDLLVDPSVLDRATKVLVDLGYVAAEGPEEERVRREHHHLHLSRPDAPPLELHFHGYSAFGEILPSAPLIARRAPSSGFRAIGVLERQDELVFLAVHAAAHRFVRFGWLYDLVLLTSAMTDRELAEAAERARAWGFGRVLAFTAALLVRWLGAPKRLLDTLSPARRASRIALRTVTEPSHPLLRSASRMVYTLALCDRKTAAARYVARASTGHARRLLRLPP